LQVGEEASDSVAVEATVVVTPCILSFAKEIQWKSRRHSNLQQV